MEWFLGYGAWGLIPLSFIDSGLMPLPEAIDILVILLTIQNHQFLLLYALAATDGSVLGCIFLYFIAARGGHAFLERRVGAKRAAKVRAAFEKYEFASLVAAGLLPPPMPLKAFVLAAGVVEVNLPKFIGALALGRGVRYLLEGYLAYEYGPRLVVWMKTQGLAFGLKFLGLVFLIAILVWWRQRSKPAPSEAVQNP